MASDTLTNGNDVYVSTLVPTGSETGNSIFALDGNDTVTGNQFNDFIFGGAGNDILNGAGGNDVLLGESGDDTLNGGSGDDLLLGGDGADRLYGGTGADRLWGGTGNDVYDLFMSDGGLDSINDDNSPTGAPGAGGGTDVLVFQDVVAADIRFVVDGNNLHVTDVTDMVDGIADTGVIIEDFFLGGNNVIEFVVGSDGAYYDFTPFV